MSNFKSVLKKAMGFGLAAELVFIGTSYYYYQKFKKDEEFRNRVQQDYPQLCESFQKMSAAYLSVLPEEWKKRILDDQPGGSTDGKQ